MTISLSSGTLVACGQPLLSNLPPSVSAVSDPQGVGLLLRFSAEKNASRHVFDAGQLSGVRRFTSLHRYEPFWMLPAAGTRGGEVCIETQFLMVQRDNGSIAVIVPLVDGLFRSALQGAGEHGLQVVIESADTSVVTNHAVGLFVAVGDDPYQLIEQAARSVNAFMGIGRLRKDKPVPAFVDQFGWCTWDSFYQEVSHDKVRFGLESFREGGITPKLLILDDGWQSERTMPAGNRALTAFSANAKFPGGLKPTVDMAKTEFGVQSFMVWHAMMGYWGGVDAETMPGYGARNAARNSTEGTKHYEPNVDRWWGPVIGLVAPEHIYRFFQDYHRHLKSQGVDGVKVDTQAALETVAQGYGGRVQLMRQYHEALEGSVHVHFKGELINCMSCAAEMLYGAMNSNVTRTSTDFWPNKPESHGLHLYINAQVSAWFGEFIFPDWDMFQSAHAMGPFHAAGRAVGGSPVYVSDKPDQHNFEVLRKIVLPDGSILRALNSGRPTLDCLFHDPTKEPVLLKIFNVNPFGGVIGAFNSRYGGEAGTASPIQGTISPADVHGLAGEQFAVYSHQAQSLRVLGKAQKFEVTMPELTWEIHTIMPIRDGFAPIGLTNMLNSGGAISSCDRDAQGGWRVELRGGGTFLAYSQAKPAKVEADGKPASFTYDQTTKALNVTLPTGKPLTMEVTF